MNFSINKKIVAFVLTVLTFFSVIEFAQPTAAMAATKKTKEYETSYDWLEFSVDETVNYKYADNMPKGKFEDVTDCFGASCDVMYRYDSTNDIRLKDKAIRLAKNFTSTDFEEYREPEASVQVYDLGTVIFPDDVYKKLSVEEKKRILEVKVGILSGALIGDVSNRYEYYMHENGREIPKYLLIAPYSMEESILEAPRKKNTNFDYYVPSYYKLQVGEDIFEEKLGMIKINVKVTDPKKLNEGATRQITSKITQNTSLKWSMAISKSKLKPAFATKVCKDVFKKPGKYTTTKYNVVSELCSDFKNAMDYAMGDKPAILYNLGTMTCEPGELASIGNAKEDILNAKIKIFEVALEEKIKKENPKCKKYVKGKKNNTYIIKTTNMTDKEMESRGKSGDKFDVHKYYSVSVYDSKGKIKDEKFIAVKVTIKVK